MTVIECLLEGKIVIRPQTTTHLLEGSFNQHDDWIVDDYLAFYNEEKQIWGAHTYSIK